MAGCEKEMAGKQNKNISKKIFLIEICYNISFEKEIPHYQR
jgi:hypothetical protein